MRSGGMAGRCRETEPAPVTGPSGARVPTGPRFVRLSEAQRHLCLEGRSWLVASRTWLMKPVSIISTDPPLAVLLQPQLVVQGLGLQV